MYHVVKVKQLIHCNNKYISAFTLIEMSIVLVIIGLILGGILVGQELISQAAVRAQVTQIQKYDSAVNTFRNKYGGLPGDLQNPYASQFGFATRGTGYGQGNGDGMVTGSNYGWEPGTGETATFWVDLSQSSLIDQSFTTASETSGPSNPVTSATTPNITAYFPQAKIGGGNYVYVWTTSNNSGFSSNYPANYYGIAAVNQILTNGKISSTPTIPVSYASAIDKKIDDGIPLSGSVQAIYVSNDPIWIGTGTDILYSAYPLSQNLSANFGSCIDNGGNSSNPTVYSTEYKNGTGPNCALSFLMQGAAR